MTRREFGVKRRRTQCSGYCEYSPAGGPELSMTTFLRLALAAFSVLLLGALVQPVTAAPISFTGDLRTDATVTDCGSGCTLGPGNTDGEYAQYAAVVRSFNVASTSLMHGMTFSYGGG